MEWLEILHRIKVGKDRHTEFKRGLDLSDIGKTICAFANTEGGVIIIGVSRMPGTIAPRTCYRFRKPPDGLTTR